MFNFYPGLYYVPYMEVKVALLWLRLCNVTYLIMCLCRQQCLVYSHLIINQQINPFVLVALASLSGPAQLSIACIQYIFRSRTGRAWERGYVILLDMGELLAVFLTHRQA